MDPEDFSDHVDFPYSGDPGDFFPDESELNNYNRWSCAKGTAESLHGMLITVCAMAAMQRMLMMTILPRWLKNVLMVACGLYAIGDVVTQEELLKSVIIFPIISLIAIRITGKLMPIHVITVGCVAALFALENLVVNGSMCRGILMLISMKLIAVSQKYREEPESFDFLTSLAYLFNPATVIFGPFITPEEFEESLELRRSFMDELKTWFASSLCIVIAVFFVVLSSCSSIGLANQNWLFVDYQTAMNFRFSHYFICILSQGCYWLIGGELWVVKPDVMEMPRSLVGVVTAWNIPMHRFLHRFIYNPSKQSCSTTVFAYLMTFIVSAALHGFNFKLSAVLITLGLYCYFENKIRNRLSTRLDSCVRARPCLTCNHRNKYSERRSTLTNLLFGLFAIYELIYLGMPFDGDTDDHTYEYQMYHTLTIWQSHNFAGHWLILAGGIVSFVV